QDAEREAGGAWGAEELVAGGPAAHGEDEARPGGHRPAVPCQLTRVAEIGLDVGVPREEAAGALVVEHCPADVAGAEPCVAEVEVEVAALPAGGEHALVLRRRVSPALLAVERVGA